MTHELLTIGGRKCLDATAGDGEMRTDGETSAMRFG